MEIKWIQNENEKFIYFGYIGKVKTSLQLEIYSESRNHAFIYNIPINYIKLKDYKNGDFNGKITKLNWEWFEGTIEECKEKANEYLKNE